MFAQKKYVVLADIESVRIPYSTFAKALNELSNYGEIAACKFYGYSSKRTKDYDEFIAENNFDALSALPKKKRGRLDLRQVIDAVRLAQFPNIDGFFLIYGNGDVTPLISYLKSYGMDVIAGCLEPDKNAALCNKIILLNEDEPIVKDVLKKGYKVVEPMSIVYIDSEAEEIQDKKVDDEKIEEALNKIIPTVDSVEDVESVQTDEEAVKETEAQLDNLMQEINNDIKAVEEELKPPFEEEVLQTEALSDVKAPQQTGNENKAENTNQFTADVVDEESQAFNYIDKENEETNEEANANELDNKYEEESISEEHNDDASKETIDDDALIAQLYKLLGGLD